MYNKKQEFIDALKENRVKIGMVMRYWMSFLLSTIAKDIFLSIQYIYLIVLGLVSWHLNDQILSILWGVMILFFIVSAIFLKKYFYILIFCVTSAILFPLSVNPYTHQMIKTGVIERKFSYEDNTIFIIRFIDRSTVTLIYGKDKQCIGKEYERKVNCRIIVSMLEKGQIR